MLCRRKPCHVLNQSENRHIDFFVLIHVNALSSICQSDLLRRADNDGTSNGNGLHERQMDVRGAGRRIENKVVKVAPVGVSNELLQRIACHSATPHDALLGVDKESDAQNLHAILLNRNDEVAPVDVFAVRTCIFQLEHFGRRRAENVTVEQANPHSHTCKSNSQIGGDRTLAYATLAARNSNNVLDARQKVGQVGTWSLQSLGFNLHFRLLASISMDGCFRSLHYTSHEGVCGLVENESKRDAESGNANIVINHLHLYNVLAGSWITHSGKSIKYELWIKIHEGIEN